MAAVAIYRVIKNSDNPAPELLYVVTGEDYAETRDKTHVTVSKLNKSAAEAGLLSMHYYIDSLPSFSVMSVDQLERITPR